MAIDVRLQYYAFIALAAAALFGASTPFAKLLLSAMTPLVLAGLLYLGSGGGLLVIFVLRKIFSPATEGATPLGLRGYGWLAGAVLVGGVLAPVLLLGGLRSSAASSASLLLNLEGVFTTLVAALLFREAVGRRIGLASLVMLAAGLLLAWTPGASLHFAPGSLAIAGACLLWALDNNLTRAISTADPVFITMVKGLAAGSVTLSLGMAEGGTLPGPVMVAGAMLLGVLSYGVSLVLFIVALRHLGSARTSAHFSTAPFAGAVLSVLLLGEPLSVSFVAAFTLMLGAIWLVVHEKHTHDHDHEVVQHTHSHQHDAHHQHGHDTAQGDGKTPHSHPHDHPPLRHTHAHLPDIHHRHGH